MSDTEINKTLSGWMNEISRAITKMTGVPLKATDRARLNELRVFTHSKAVADIVEWCEEEYHNGYFGVASKLYRIAEQMNGRSEAWRNRT